ncbi:unnamed protein product [Mortierella alpina]
MVECLPTTCKRLALILNRLFIFFLPFHRYSEGGFFRAIMTFPPEYPLLPPKLRFTTDIYHPNVYPDGEVCISILHPPGEDKYGYEQASERWLPVHTVETILISVISMLSSPNDESPANIEAAVRIRKWCEIKASEPYSGELTLFYVHAMLLTIARRKSGAMTTRRTRKRCSDSQDARQRTCNTQRRTLVCPREIGKRNKSNTRGVWKSLYYYAGAWARMLSKDLYSFCPNLQSKIAQIHVAQTQVELNPLCIFGVPFPFGICILHEVPAYRTIATLVFVIVIVLLSALFFVVVVLLLKHGLRDQSIL